MKKAMIFLATILLTLPLVAQHQNKAVLSTADGEQQLNTSEIQCIRFDGGRVTVVQPWGTTVFDRTLRELTFLRPLPGTVRLTVDATIGSDTESVSRRALSLGGDGKVRSTWETGDRVYVYANNTSTESLGTLTPETTGAATARLVGDVAVDGLTNGQTLYLSTMPRPHTFAAQTGRLEDIFFATAQSALTIVEGNASLANTTFVNAQAITRFTMKDGYGNDVSVSQLVITGGAGTITVTPAAAMKELYVAMPATAAQTTYSFTATAADGVRSGVKTANVQQGNYYRTSVTVKLTASVSAAPTPKNWLTYNGSTQQLVNAGTTVGGTMKYAVTTTNSQPNSGFSTTIPTGINYGTYYVWYYVEGDADHHSSGVAGPVTVSIAKKALTITAKAQTVNYGTGISTGTGQITADGLCSGHSVTAITLSQSRTDAGSGTITPSAATVKDGSGNTVTSNYSITYNTGVLTINTVPASVASAPTAKSGLVYNGSGQQLINAGTASGGTMMYAVTTTNSKPSTGYSNTLPTGTNAGTYYVWYYVAGDSNHTDTGVSSTAVSVTIDKAAATITLSSTSIEIKKGTSMEITATLSATSNTTVTVTSGNSSYVGASARAVGNNVYNINVTGNAVTSGTINVTISATSDNYTYTSKTCAVTVKTSSYMSDDYRIGYIYYSDGTYSKDRDYSKTPIGIIAYINDGSAAGDALTEKSAGYGHGLIINISDSMDGAMSNRNISELQSLLRNYSDQFPENGCDANDSHMNDFGGLGKTASLYEAPFYVRGVNSVYYATGCSSTSYWFIPSSGQMIAALESLAGVTIEDDFDLYGGAPTINIQRRFSNKGFAAWPEENHSYWTSSVCDLGGPTFFSVDCEEGPTLHTNDNPCDSDGDYYRFRAFCAF